MDEKEIKYRENAELFLDIAKRHDYSEENIELLITKLNDDDERVRFDAADTLGYYVGYRAASRIVQALTDENHFVREGAANAIGYYSENKSIHNIIIEPLINCLKDEYEGVRFYAARALCDSRDLRALPYLEQVAQTDPEPEVRREASYASKYIVIQSKYHP